MAKEANYFEYDADVFQNSIDTYNEQITQLTDLMAKVDAAVEDLRKDWDTDAGHEFFKSYDEDWKDIVEQYIELAKFLKESILIAKLNFNPIVEEIEELDF